MKQKIFIKKTCKSDSSLFFFLRNNKSNRKYSGNTFRINRKNHDEWFIQNYKSKLFYTCFYNTKKIGYIRGEDKNSIITISIAISKKYQGKGYASKLYEMFENKIRSNSIILAKVNISNKPSIKFFLKKNYEILNKNKKNLLLYKIYNNKIEKHLKIIDNIEKIRKHNNVNWMNILRVAFRNSPASASSIFKKINFDDSKIKNFSKKLF
jgi:ribosomal protein S18 acetylase RimI-like enzyme